MSLEVEEDDHVANFIDVSDYPTLRDFDDIPLDFKKPEKNKKNIYIAALEEPLCFYLPPSSVMEVYQDDLKMNNLKFILDLEENSEYIQFLYNLEESISWFKKELSEKIIKDYYDPPYDIIKSKSNDKIFFVKILIDNLELLNDLAEYQPNSNGRLLVVFEGIRFYRKSFSPLLRLVRIDDIEDDDSLFDSESSSESEIMLEQEINDKKDIDLLSNLTEGEQRLSKGDKGDKVDKGDKGDRGDKEDKGETNPRSDNIVDPSLTKKIDGEVLKQLADIPLNNQKDLSTLNTDIENISLKTLNSSAFIKPTTKNNQSNQQQKVNMIGLTETDIKSIMSTASKMTVQELEGLIKNKRTESEKVHKNVERVSKTADMLKVQAIKLAQEIQSYEKVLEEVSIKSNVSQSTSLLKK
jgi:hypothetical protein